MRGKLIVLLFLLIGFIVNAQNFCAPGANWRYKHLTMFVNAYRNGIEELKYTKTVVVNGETCAEISRTFTGQIGGPTSVVNTYTFASIYTFERNSVYYIFDGGTNTFDTIVNFNASIGDKWECPFNFIPCSVKPKVTVTGIGQMNINSHTLRYIVVNGGWSSIDTVVEKIAGFNHFFAPYYKCVFDAPNHPDFICYSDNNFPLYQKYQAHNCYYDVGLKEQENYNGILSVYPNPSFDKLRINFSGNSNLNQAMSVIIYNSTGKKVIERNFVENDVIDISQLSVGVYYIKLNAEKLHYDTKFSVYR